MHFYWVTVYNRYWSICKYKLNYAHHETAASIVIVFLMAKCERIVHKSFLSYLSCAEATWYRTKMLTINCPSTWGSLSGL